MVTSADGGRRRWSSRPGPATGGCMTVRDADRGEGPPDTMPGHDGDARSRRSAPRHAANGSRRRSGRSLPGRRRRGARYGSRCGRSVALNFDGLSRVGIDRAYRVIVIAACASFSLPRRAGADHATVPGLRARTCVPREVSLTLAASAVPVGAAASARAAAGSGTRCPRPISLATSIVPVVHLHDRPRDREPEAASRRARLAGVRAAVEALEDVRQLVGGDARARCRAPRSRPRRGRSSTSHRYAAARAA